MMWLAIILAASLAAFGWMALTAPYADETDERGFFLTDEEGNPL